jgi:hypothetical protein
MAGTPANDPAAALAGMAKTGNPRVPMGDAAYTLNHGYTPSKNTSLRPKGGAQAGDPSAPGSKADRAQGGYPKPAGKGDRNGAGYRVQAVFPPHQAPEAGATQANGRVVGSAINRSLPAFTDGSEPSYL